MFTVEIYGSPVLRTKALQVESFDDGLKTFAAQLVETMKAEDGVGLAAPQVARSIRVAVIDATGGEKPPFVLVNPTITFFSDEREDYEEGCLSVPEIRIKINRPSRVSVRAFDVDGKEYVIEDASGLLARALQHEIDHLDGILFVDRASPVQRQLVSGKLKKLARSHKRGGRSVPSSGESRPL